MITKYHPLALGFIMVLVYSLPSVSLAETYGGGNGTVEDPYQIWTPEQMNTIGLNPGDWGKYFKLMADIDMSAYTGRQYNIIGTSWANYFTGIFDGNGHVISNLTYSASSKDYVGLFGYVFSGGQILNLGVENMNITGNDYVGGLVGNNSGTITACYTTGTIIGSGDYVGGLVGYNSGSTITACNTEGTFSGDDHVGGLVGKNYNGTIMSCYVTGVISSSGDVVGGLVGYNDHGIITACYTTGSVSGIQRVGGLVGNNGYDGGTITYCYATGSVSGYDLVGGLVGQNDLSIIMNSFWDTQTSGQTNSSGGRGLTTEQMKTLSIFQNAGWADRGWVMSDGIDYPHLDWEDAGGVPIPSPQAIPLTGSGTAEDPYLISTAEEFALLSWYPDVLNKHIRLIANLDLNGITLYPIGDLGLFTGVFDGNGHTISNAVINQPISNYVGLFSIVGPDGQILNLGVENIKVTGYKNIGGLVGKNNEGAIMSCYVTGIISGSGGSVGGLVGYNYFGTITVCYTVATINGDWGVGGLVGYSYGGKLAQCYATDSVVGSNCVGGLVGNMHGGSITHCYATGSVRGDDTVGGLVGDNYSILTHCYATGSVSGSSLVGGLVGSNTYANTTCYWDIQTSGMTTSDGGTGKTTAEMQTLSTFISAGWDFTNEISNGTNDIWRMCTDGVNYPRLNWESTDGDFVCPNGVDTDDLMYYVDHWLIGVCSPDNNYCGGADLNYSGAVDLADFVIFAENWLKEDKISGHVFMIEMSLSYDFGEGYASSVPVDYEFDAWMRVDDTVVSGTIRTPGGAVYPAEMETDDNENWLGIGEGSDSLEDLADFTDGEYIFTVVYANGTSQSTSILFALEDGSPIPPVDHVLVAEYPVHHSTDVPLTIDVELISLDNPDWTYGLEWFPVDEESDALSGGLEELPYTTTTAGPLNLSPNTLYEIELTANHAIWSTNEDGIPYVVDKDSEVEIHFTTVSEP